MDKHFRILGYLFIVWGIVDLITILLIPFLPALSRAGAQSVPAWAMGISLVIAVFFLVTGWSLLAKKEWSRQAAILGSILALFSFPFGTALGFYGFWAMFSVAGKGAFRTYTGGTALGGHV